MTTTTPPISRDAFLAWAKGKKVCFSWDTENYYHSFKAYPEDEEFVLCKNEDNESETWLWNDQHWREYEETP